MATTKTITQAVFENLDLIYGRMKSIISDLGTEFKNEIFWELCKMLNTNKKFSFNSLSPPNGRVLHKSEYYRLGHVFKVFCIFSQ